MLPLPTFLIRLRRTAFVLPAALGVALLGGSLSTYAKPIPSNLGNGLDKLVASQQAVTTAQAKGTRLNNAVTVDGKVYADAATAAVAKNILGDSQGRVLVRITLNGARSFKNTRKAIKAAASSLSITAKDKTYRGVGIMNAYVDVADVPALAQAPGVSAVILEWRPYTSKSILKQALVTPSVGAKAGETLLKLGTAFDQGVTQHRVDQLDKLYNANATLDLQGQGVKIACLSNSYANRSTYTTGTAANPVVTNVSVTNDVNNGDLPGGANDPAGNTTPVFVLQDDTASPNTSDDEGRGMVQILHKMAPKAALGFASADFGEVGFANNIRGLAGIAPYAGTDATGTTFRADTECDDVGYLDEPFFQDGIIANGVDDATAAGTAYFSSANNNIGTNGYDSDLRFVANGTGTTAAAGNAALAGTNINLANVPANLYAGGFHNFNPGGGQDVAQTVNDDDLIAAQVYGQQFPVILQWNEPYDQTTQPNNLQTVYTASGNYTSTATDGSGDQTYTITPALVAGTLYQFVEAAASGSSFDGVITIFDPSGNVLVGPQDTGTDETARFIAPVSGTGYTVKIGHYSATTGAYNLTLSSSTGFTGNVVQTQISLLVFDTNGNYLPNSSLTTNALTTNEPIQLGYPAPTAGTQVQFVIARANVPTGPNVATHVRYLFYGNGVAGYGPAEYFTYNTVTTAGHSMAATNNGVAAYSTFRPSLPESFTGGGPVTIYYDKMNNRLSTPEIRLQPHIAAADGGNVSSNMNGYFVSDSTSDPDTNGNFSGTSAAAPHATAIAALVLQNKGGRGTVTPAQMTSLLERSTFPHDLDPNSATGAARVTGGTTGTGKVVITVNSDDSNGTLGITGGAAVRVLGTTGTGVDDNNAFTVSYVGGSSVTSLVFNPGGTAATGGNTTGGNNGVTYSTTPTTVGGTATYFENSLPGVAFFPATKPFTLGNGITTATALFTNPSNVAATQDYTMTVTIPAGSMTGGNLLRFGVGRGLARSATTGGTYNAVTSATTGAALYTADLFGGGVSLPSGTVGNGMTFSGTTADGGTFTGVINNRIGSGWATQDGYGFINAETAVSQTVQ